MTSLSGRNVGVICTFLLFMGACIYDCAATPSSLQLSNTLGSHMVLQRDSTATRVWGFASPGVCVVTTFVGLNYTSCAGADGQWTQPLPSTPAGGPYDLSFASSDGGRAQLTDVLFGDVFFCSGQSNLGIPLSYVTNSSAELARAALPLYARIRTFYAMPAVSATPLQQLPSVNVPWTTANSSSTAGFSAMCWLSLSRAFDALGGSSAPPFGLVESDMGGTCIQEWSSPRALSACAAPPAPEGNASDRYNAMVVPFMRGPMAVKGFLWYQGEANSGSDVQASYYACALPTLISDWRGSFGIRNASTGAGVFIIIQLAAWNGSAGTDGISLVREVQLNTSLAMPLVLLATSIDGGDPLAPLTSIHPRPKQIPAQRAADVLVAAVYQSSSPAPNPAYVSAVGWVDAAGAHANVTLGPFAGGDVLQWVPPNPASNSSVCPTWYAIPADACDWMALQTSDGVWHNASVTIRDDGRSVTLSAAGVDAGITVAATRNGWAPWPVVNLYTLQTQLPVQPWLRQTV